MGLKNINFVLGNGGLGRPLLGQDFISGQVFYSSTVPSGFASTVAQQLFSINQAEQLGIKDDYNDETKAIATITLTLGASGDTISIQVIEPTTIYNNQTVVNFGTYTVLSSDTSGTILATSLKTFINAQTYITGYTATSTTDVLSIIARPGLGLAMNAGTPLVATFTGTTSGTVVQFAGGVASKQAEWHYQISEFFRIQPQGILWVGFFPIPSTYNFVELNTIQVQSSGIIRQFGVYSPHGLTISNIEADIDAIQVVCNTMLSNYSPASVIYSSNMVSITDLSTLPNLRLRNDPNVSVVIGQDVGGLGGLLSVTCGKSIPCLGAALGTVALASVSEDIGWVGKFNLSNGTEDEVIGFTNGSTWNTLYATEYNLLVELDAYGYIFLQKKNNINGSYINDSHCAVSITSDYAYIENNRTIGKAIRLTYSSLVTFGNSPLVLNADGTLSNPTIAAFVDAPANNLDQMVRNGELSDYQIKVNPMQNVLATSTVIVTLQLLPVGVARMIEVQIGYVTKL